MDKTSKQPPDIEELPGDKLQSHETEKQARIAKLAAEESLIAIEVATDAHLFGAIGGVILSVCFTLYQITKKQRD